MKTNIGRIVAAGAISAAGLLAIGGTASAAPTPKTECSTSHHSDTGRGANQSGAYDSTCDGSAAQNGNGRGNANGRPCAGCVGNADDKNPPGQAPDGSDSNAGYECDTNNGVGKTNPAHTGCQSSYPGGS